LRLNVALNIPAIHRDFSSPGSKTKRPSGFDARAEVRTKKKAFDFSKA
jgi:hypothetical protein